jgi:hypothetical protein
MMSSRVPSPMYMSTSFLQPGDTPTRRTENPVGPALSRALQPRAANQLSWRRRPKGNATQNQTKKTAAAIPMEMVAVEL